MYIAVISLVDVRVLSAPGVWLVKSHSSTDYAPLIRDRASYVRGETEIMIARDTLANIRSRSAHAILRLS